MYTDDGLLEMYRSKYSRGDRPYGTVAIGFLSTWVNTALVGLDEKATDLLGFALEFAQRSIEVTRSKDRELEGARWRASRTRALAAWARRNENERALWIEAAKLHATECRDLEPQLLPNDRTKLQVDQLLLRAHAQQPDEALAYYEARAGAADERLKVSSATKRIVLEYARASRDPSLRTELLHRAGRRILADKLESLFGHMGQMEQGASWLALVYGGPGSPLTPPQIIRKAYENMPNTPWPEFLPPD